MNELTFSEISVGFTQSFKKIITQQMEDDFRAITGDENPLHKDDYFAKSISKNKYKQHVAFGMLTASLYSTLAGIYLPGKYSLIHSFEKLEFRNAVFVGDLLTVEGVCTEKYEALKLLQIKCTIKNQNNEIVSKAKLKVLVLK